MALKGEVFKLCKYIIASPFREEVRQLIRSLTFHSDGDPENRSSYGYYARQQNAQFSGYIYLEQSRGFLYNGPHQIVLPPLTAQEISVLSRADAIVRLVVSKCVEELVREFPKLSDCLDLYQGLGLVVKRVDISSDFYFDLKSLVKEFKLTRQYQALVGVPRQLVAGISSDKWVNTYHFFRERLNEFGVHDLPGDIKELFSKPVVQPDSTIQDMIFSVVSLIETLRSLSQMIFQAYVSDKLVAFTEDNVIDIVEHNHSYVGEGITILSQPTIEERLLSPGDITLIKLTSDVFSIDAIARIYGCSFSMSREDGYTNQYQMRVMDDGLNPYFSLIR